MNRVMEKEPRRPSRTAVALFIALSGAYYGAYFAVFGRRVADYWADVLRHFEFARRLFG